MFIVRRVLNGLAIAFAVYLAARALIWATPPALPVALIAWTVAIMVVTVVSVYACPRGAAGGPPRMPVGVAVAAVAVSAFAPTGIALAAGDGQRTAPFATVYIGAVGVLLVVTMVRRRPVLAWAGVVAFSLSSMAWLGAFDALAYGLVGSIVWVAVADLLVRLLDRAALDTLRFAEVERAAAAERADQEVRRRERRVRVRQALRVAGPVLAQVIETRGRLTDDERAQARLAEAELRDELRAGRLLDDAVRASIAAARRRGTIVTVFDEGGLDDLDEAAAVAVRAELSAAIAESAGARLIIRTAPDAHTAVTVVGRGVDGAQETVDTWLEIPRER